MKKWACLLGMALFLAGSAALAQVDPDPDGVGLYFDEGATIYCGDHTPNIPTNVYLCLTNGSAAGGVFGWECQINFDATVFILDPGLSGGGLNVGTPPDYVVGIPSPLPYAPSNILATFQTLSLTPLCTWVYMAPLLNASIPGEMAYADGADPGNLIVMRGSTGGPDEPVYGFNCDCPPPVDNVTETWGSVKDLYR